MRILADDLGDRVRALKVESFTVQGDTEAGFLGIQFDHSRNNQE